MKALQSCVNSARKAEGKVKRILAEKEQWIAYDQEMKTAYLTEKKRHSQNMEQLEEDLRLALAQQKEARLRVREAARASEKEGIREGEASGVAEMEEEDPCACLVDRSENHQPQDDKALQEVLQRAFQEAATTPGTGVACPSTPPTLAALPRTPSQVRRSCPTMLTGGPHGAGPPSSRLQPFPPPLMPPTASNCAQVRPPLPAASDPYLGAASPQGAQHAEALQTSPPLGRPKPPKQRVSIKDASKPTGPIHHRVHSPGLSQIVENKRRWAQERVAHRGTMQDSR